MIKFTDIQSDRVIPITISDSKKYRFVTKIVESASVLRVINQVNRSKRFAMISHFSE